MKILVALFIYSDRCRKETEVHCRNQNESGQSFRRCYPIKRKHRFSILRICFFLLCGYRKQRRLSYEQREVRNGHLVQEIVIWCSELTITNAFSDIINKICDWK